MGVGHCAAVAAVVAVVADERAVGKTADSEAASDAAEAASVGSATVVGPVTVAGIEKDCLSKCWMSDEVGIPTLPMASR